MEKEDKKTITGKANLIYEYNRNSPLFVKIADSNIDENNIDYAVEVLNIGLKTYPDHPVAHLLLGKAYSIMGKYNTAGEYFKKGSEIIQSSETYNFYMNELESIRKQRSLFEVTRGNTFFNPSKVTGEKTNEPNLFNPGSKVQSEQELTSSIDEKLAHLAEEISKAKLSAPLSGNAANNDFLNILSKDNMIVSETLAKIYIAQNEYDEAIKVYEKLIKKEPAEYERYTDKIKEIRSKISS
jgi:tetratricopeptide (TPR) repeat protein